MIKNLILSLVLLSSISFANEETKSNEEKKFDLCFFKSDFVEHFFLQNCDPNKEASCIYQARKIWLLHYESCITKPLEEVKR